MDAGFAILATPPKKDKAPENNADGEEENTATSTEAEMPTKIDIDEAMQSSQEQPHPEERYPDKTDDGS